MHASKHIGLQVVELHAVELQAASVASLHSAQPGALTPCCAGGGSALHSDAACAP